MLRALAPSCLLVAGCAVMQPVPPPPELEPVAIGDGTGSGRTYVDPGLPPDVELHWDGRDALLVRPTINETDVGWFVLDTGASGMMITSKAARKAGLVPMGSTQLQTGAQTTVFLSESFQLGPLTLNGTRYAGADFPFSRPTFGEKAQGVCGYDLLAQTVFELDASGRRIRINDPEIYELTEGRWEELFVYMSLPHVTCRFEGGHTGIFLLDAGYAGAVAFFDNAVEELDLLDDRQTRGQWILNFGGRTQVREGGLEWFEIGGRRFDDIENVHYATSPVAIYMGPEEVMGIVGMRLMSQFRIVFDYSNGRVAFLPSIAAESP